MVVEESIHVSFNENNENIPTIQQSEDDEREILEKPIKEENKNSQIEKEYEEYRDTTIHRERTYVDESRILRDVS